MFENLFVFGDNSIKEGIFIGNPFVLLLEVSYLTTGHLKRVRLFGFEDVHLEIDVVITVWVYL